MSTDSGSDEKTEKPYRMTLSYNVLNHLGLNLYSNVPAVLSEAVANAWDADANEVEVLIEPDEDQIEITDDGFGMTQEEVNKRYLNVGYSRREDDEREDVTPEEKRPVMGRKGIGKLSLFSIANTVEVYTKKNGEENALRMVVEDIEEKIKSEHEGKTATDDREPYYPDSIDYDEFPIDEESGTHLVLTDLKKQTWTAAKYLRRRLARRFSVISDKHNFHVSVNEEKITIEDREYYSKVQYLWTIGDGGDEYRENSDALKTHKISGDLDDYTGDDIEDDLSVSGWIATAEKSGHLNESSGDINKIPILMRGRIAQEDIMEDISEGNVYTSYLFGEIHADFLDDTDKDDAATSNRERIKKTDSRYQALLEYAKDNIRDIGNQWKNYRSEKGVDEATEVEAIDEWYSELSPDKQERAKTMFGTINEMSIDDDEEREKLFTHSVLAFESLRQKESLDRLEQISPDNWQAISSVLGEVDDIEASLYHQIVKQRLSVIQKLKEDTDENVLEKVLQEHLYEYPWLLDPGWERATEEKRKEEQLTTYFEELGDELLTDDEESGRYDLMLMQTGGKYVLVELKRYDPTYRLTEADLYEQIKKYEKALKKILLTHHGMDDPNVEIITVIGEDLDDWSDDGVDDQRSANEAFETFNARIIRYDELIESSYSHYQEFLAEREEKLGRIESVVDAIRGEMSEATEQESEEKGTSPGTAD